MQLDYFLTGRGGWRKAKENLFSSASGLTISIFSKALIRLCTMAAFYIGTETINEFLLFLNLFFLVIICLSLSFQTGSTFLEIKGVISLVAIECAELQFNRPLSNGFQNAWSWEITKMEP